MKLQNMCELVAIPYTECVMRPNTVDYGTVQLGPISTLVLIVSLQQAWSRGRHHLSYGAQAGILKMSQEQSSWCMWMRTFTKASIMDSVTMHETFCCTAPFPPVWVLALGDVVPTHSVVLTRMPAHSNHSMMALHTTRRWSWSSSTIVPGTGPIRALPGSNPVFHINATTAHPPARLIDRQPPMPQQAKHLSRSTTWSVVPVDCSKPAVQQTVKARVCNYDIMIVQWILLVCWLLGHQGCCYCCCCCMPVSAQKGISLQALHAHSNLSQQTLIVQISPGQGLSKCRKLSWTLPCN